MLQRVIKAEQLDFSENNSTPVVSSAMKFILPIPKMKGEAFEVKDWEGNSVKGEGLKFFNYKDNCDQGVATDGQGVIIFNGVKPATAKALQTKIDRLSKGNPENLNLDNLKEILKYAKETIGLEDRYDSDKDFINSKMNAVETASTNHECYGLHRRDDRDVCQAVFLIGKGEFEGPGASPQKFENGAVILKQGDAVRLIQPDQFAKDYRHKDGEKITELSKELAVQNVSKIEKTATIDFAMKKKQR
ncbi:MAG: hypothetical protein KAJ75_08585 [Alphaproteobacteria bacterium]|nr:hypothetical protein [Alphaproteobacteria bacterium]